MPIYMDIHIVSGVKAKEVAQAHQFDLMHEKSYGCRCMTYWVDEERENVFCLIDAPDKAAVEELHRKAHGLIPHKVIEVNSSLVQSFLGRIYDPEDAVTEDDGLKVFHDPSFRVLLVASTEDPVLLRNRLGRENADALLAKVKEKIRAGLAPFGGREVEYGSTDLIGSFRLAAKALASAGQILQSLSAAEMEQTGFRITLHGGEPVGKSNALYGDTLQLNHWLSFITRSGELAISSVIADLLKKDQGPAQATRYKILAPADEPVFFQLFSCLEENWQDPDFDMEEYGQGMTMSKSQLYRKTVSLTGLSPNLLLRDFRLEKARILMKKKAFSISQITYDTGFSSPSYFTKCFKKKFGLLPMAYLELSD